jgi:hypothetical protein
MISNAKTKFKSFCPTQNFVEIGCLDLDLCIFVVSICRVRAVEVKEKNDAGQQPKKRP